MKSIGLENFKKTKSHRIALRLIYYRINKNDMNLVGSAAI